MSRIQDYTRNRFLSLVEEIIEANGTEEHQDELIEEFEKICEHPNGSDLIF